MKKLLLILMCVLFASAAFAQFDLGIKLGANYSYIQSEQFDFQEYIDEFSDLNNITGFVGGLFAGIGFGSFGIQAEGLFSMEGFYLEDIIDGDPGDAIENTTIMTNYLNAALLARYNFNLPLIQPYLCAGVNVGVPLDTEFDPDLINIEDFNLNKIGLAFGGGVNVFDMVDVDLRWVKGITDIYTAETDGENARFANLIRLSLGLYIF
jgi:hypothetical protein